MVFNIFLGVFLAGLALFFVYWSFTTGIWVYLIGIPVGIFFVLFYVDKTGKYYLNLKDKHKSNGDNNLKKIQRLLVLIGIFSFMIVILFIALILVLSIFKLN